MHVKEKLAARRRKARQTQQRGGGGTPLIAIQSGAELFPQIGGGGGGGGMRRNFLGSDAAQAQFLIAEHELDKQRLQIAQQFSRQQQQDNMKKRLAERRKTMAERRRRMSTQSPGDSSAGGTPGSIGTIALMTPSSLGTLGSPIVQGPGAALVSIGTSRALPLGGGGAAQGPSLPSLRPPGSSGMGGPGRSSISSVGGAMSPAAGPRGPGRASLGAIAEASAAARRLSGGHGHGSPGVSRRPSGGHHRRHGSTPVAGPMAGPGRASIASMPGGVGSPGGRASIGPRLSGAQIGKRPSGLNMPGAIVARGGGRASVMSSPGR